jgi:hypothetical protein
MKYNILISCLIFLFLFGLVSAQADLLTPDLIEQLEPEQIQEMLSQSENLMESYGGDSELVKNALNKAYPHLTFDEPSKYSELLIEEGVLNIERDYGQSYSFPLDNDELKGEVSFNKGPLVFTPNENFREIYEIPEGRFRMPNTIQEKEILFNGVRFGSGELEINEGEVFLISEKTNLDGVKLTSYCGFFPNRLNGCAHRDAVRTQLFFDGMPQGPSDKPYISLNGAEGRMFVHAPLNPGNGERIQTLTLDMSTQEGNPYLYSNEDYYEWNPIPENIFGQVANNPSAQNVRFAIQNSEMEIFNRRDQNLIPHIDVWEIDPSSSQYFKFFNGETPITFLGPVGSERGRLHLTGPSGSRSIDYNNDALFGDEIRPAVPVILSFLDENGDNFFSDDLNLLEGKVTGDLLFYGSGSLVYLEGHNSIILNKRNVFDRKSHIMEELINRNPKVSRNFFSEGWHNALSNVLEIDGIKLIADEELIDPKTFLSITDSFQDLTPDLRNSVNSFRLLSEEDWDRPWTAGYATGDKISHKTTPASLLPSTIAHEATHALDFSIRNLEKNAWGEFLIEKKIINSVDEINSDLISMKIRRFEADINKIAADYMVKHDILLDPNKRIVTVGDSLHLFLETDFGGGMAGGTKADFIDIKEIFSDPTQYSRLLEERKILFEEKSKIVSLKRNAEKYRPEFNGENFKFSEVWDSIASQGAPLDENGEKQLYGYDLKPPSPGGTSNSIEWADGTDGPRHGCIRPYGCNNRREGFATIVEKVIEDSKGYDDLIAPDLIDPRYIQRLAVANRFDTYGRTFRALPANWLENKMRELGWDEDCIEQVTGVRGWEASCIEGYMFRPYPQN